MDHDGDDSQHVGYTDSLDEDQDMDTDQGIIPQSADSNMDVDNSVRFFLVFFFLSL